MLSLVDRVGAWVLTALASVGAVATFGGRAVIEAFRPPYEPGEILRHLYQFGTRSAPLILIHETDARRSARSDGGLRREHGCAQTQLSPSRLLQRHAVRVWLSSAVLFETDPDTKTERLTDDGKARLDSAIAPFLDRITNCIVIIEGLATSDYRATVRPVAGARFDGT